MGGEADGADRQPGHPISGVAVGEEREWTTLG
jgi:hypothetical protein